MYFNTNYKAPKSRIIMIDIGKKFDSKNIDPSIHEVLPEHKLFPITSSAIVGGKLAIKYMENASDRLYFFDLSVPAKKLNQVQLPKICSIYKMDGKHNETKLEVKINDFISPGAAYEIDTNDYSVKLVRKSELPDKTFNS
jgi:prolyl oligopeptidase PreP (S9A serine peptidase family)